MDANPILRQRGTSELRPLVLDVFEHHVANGAAPVARYTVDLRTGEVFIELTLTKPEERVRSGIVG